MDFKVHTAGFDTKDCGGNITLRRMGDGNASKRHCWAFEWVPSLGVWWKRAVIMETNLCGCQ